MKKLLLLTLVTSFAIGVPVDSKDALWDAFIGAVKKGDTEAAGPLVPGQIGLFERSPKTHKIYPGMRPITIAINEFSSAVQRAAMDWDLLRDQAFILFALNLALNFPPYRTIVDPVAPPAVANKEDLWTRLVIAICNGDNKTVLALVPSQIGLFEKSPKSLKKYGNVTAMTIAINELRSAILNKSVALVKSLRTVISSLDILLKAPPYNKIMEPIRAEQPKPVAPAPAPKPAAPEQPKPAVAPAAAPVAAQEPQKLTKDDVLNILRQTIPRVYDYQARNDAEQALADPRGLAFMQAVVTLDIEEARKTIKNFDCSVHCLDYIMNVLHDEWENKKPCIAPNDPLRLKKINDLIGVIDTVKYERKE